MKFLKHFESEKQFREVDLTELFNNYIKYKYMSKENYLKLKDPDVYFWNSEYNRISKDFNDNVLNPLLLNREIEFLRAVHPYDDEVIYGSSGRVKDIRIDKEYSMIYYIVYLYDEKNAFYLLKIPRFNRPEPTIVKIYNSESISIEDEITLYINAEKYNL